MNRLLRFSWLTTPVLVGVPTGTTFAGISSFNPAAYAVQPQ